MKRDGGKYWDTPGSRLTVSEGRDATGLGKVGREGGPGESRWGGQGQVPKEPQWPLSYEWRELFLD